MLRRLLFLLRGWFAPAPKRARRSGTMPEPLESRIAPATFVNAHLVTYTDIDGDHVSVTSSRPIFTSGTNGNVNSIFTFSTGSVNGSNAAEQQLQNIDLTSLGSNVVFGDNLSVTVVKAGGGDGFANVGSIESSFGLGHVTVQGDLGHIDAGPLGPENITYVGLASLTVHSLGAQGTATQAAGGNLLSTIFGEVGSITVQKDMINAQISVNTNTPGIGINGSVNSIFIGGNLQGGSNTLDGSISTNGSVQSIFIGGSILGGAGQNSGSLQIGEKIGSLSVGGNILGYALISDTTPMGAGSASVVTGNNFPSIGGIGSINIKGNLQGGEGGGSAEFSELNTTGGDFGSVTIGGAIIGGTGANSGELNANGFGAISIGHGITGSSGESSGLVTTPNGIASITILSGGIVGGTADNSGAIIAGTSPVANGAEFISSIVIHGDITGVSNATAFVTSTPGQINSAVPIDSFTLYGSLVGSAGAESGSLVSSQPIGHIALHPSGASTGSLLGGAGANSGEITALSIGSVSLSGQILGSTGPGSGKIVTTAGIGPVVVGDGITGGVGNGSGDIIAGTPTSFGANLASLTVTTGGITGGMGDDSGQINIGGAIGALHVTGGAITGGVGVSSGAIISTDNVGSISAGSLIIGSGAGSGEISIGGNLTSLSFTGASSSSAPTVTGVVDVSGYAASVSVHGDVVGAGASTGLFEIGGGVNVFSISGALRGGSGLDSGAIFAGLNNTGIIGSLTVSGGLLGGGGDGSAEVFAGGGITHTTVADIIGGGGQSSGSLVSDGALGTISVTGTASGQTTHGVVGGMGIGSGQISAGTTIGSVAIHGSVAGGGGTGSGVIASSSSFTPTGDIQGNVGSISITGNVTGGAGANSGQLSVAGNLTTLSITGNVTGAAVSGTGAILAGVDLTGVTGGNITTLAIRGALQGAIIPASTGTVTGSGYIEAGHIGSAVIGSIQAGSVAGGNTVTDDGAILASNDIASLSVTGAITGDSSNPVLISAVGQVTPGKLDLAFGKISVGAAVTYANFLAGYDQTGAPVNGAASIGSVVVGGDWSGSNLVAGVLAPANGHFGDPHATLITSSPSVIPTIASIIIKGRVVDAPVTASPDTYGFVARQINAFSVNGKPQSLSNGLIDPVDQSDDTALRDVS